ncbi:MAG: SDR family NAD(P)-dependent oxidoreductase [Spirochaetes bacterium]|nr:SDR family NAD(P)-dependent oxidoreductase [Spirochaetota bacterium]
MKNKKILITGGTGTFGNAFVKRILKEDVKKVYIFSRDECKQWKMREQFKDERIQYLIGDIRDKDRLYRAFEGINYVIHAAAQKHVPSCEYNPIEAVKTNINSAENIINAAIDRGVEKVLSISTDKAVKPINLYGCTKAVMEKLFIHGNNYCGNKNTKFSCVRYGNVIGSRGSVIELWNKQMKDEGHISLTDLNMTRFWITIENAVEFVVKSLKLMEGEEIFIPKLKCLEVRKLAQLFTNDKNIKMIGIRQGEKLHEILFSKEESQRTIEIDNSFFIVYPSIYKLNLNYDRWDNHKGMFFNNNDYSSMDQDEINIKEMEKLIK